MKLNKVAWAWGPIWYCYLLAKENWFDILLISALLWLVLKAIWLMMVANVRLAAMGL